MRHGVRFHGRNLGFSDAVFKRQDLKASKEDQVYPQVKDVSAAGKTAKDTGVELSGLHLPCSSSPALVSFLMAGI